MIVFAGCGALGSFIAMSIVDPEHEYLLIDDGRVGEENIGTSAYFRQQVGMWKVDALSELMYHKVGSDLRLHTYKTTLIVPVDTILYTGHTNTGNLFVDTFDNSDSRELVYNSRDGCAVHVGVSEEHTGAVTWDECWIPPGGPPRGENPICTHHLGRKILRFTAAVAAGIIENYLEVGRYRSVMVTENLSVLE